MGYSLHILVRHPESPSVDALALLNAWGVQTRKGMGHNSESIEFDAVDAGSAEALFKPSTSRVDHDIDQVVYRLEHLSGEHPGFGIQLQDDYGSELFEAG